MQVLILAAGLGNRLRPMTEAVPKCLVEVSGTPLIINALDILSGYKIDRVIIVTGHLGNVVKKRIGKKYKGIDIIYVDNPIYDKTNNIYSLWLARDFLDKDTLLMECDIYFEKKLIDKIFAQKAKDTVVVGRFHPGMDGTVIEMGKRNEITRMIPANKQNENFIYHDKYKTVNIYWFTKKFLSSIFVKRLKRYIARKQNDKYYELILAVLISEKKAKMHAAVMDGVRWIEIDDFFDLEQAKILFSDAGMRYESVKRIHGGYWRYNFMDFSYLYNLYFPTPQLINEIRVSLKELIGNYPSGQKDITKSLAKWAQVNPQSLVVANGASEIIAALKVNKIKKITMHLPTFNEYERDFKKEQITYVKPDAETFSFGLDEFIKTAKDSHSDTALIINPNNPTSYYIKPKEIKYLLDNLKSLDRVLLDESFIDFAAEDVNETMLRELNRYKNLVVIRSLSKDLGVPGLRLGYAASSNEEIIRLLRKSVPIWNINSMAEHFLEVLPKYKEAYKASLKKMAENRDYFYKKLQSIKGIKAFKPHANFVFVKLLDKANSSDLERDMFVNSNILIKDCSNKTSLEDKKYIRISVRKKEEIDYFIKEFKKC